MSQQRRSTRLKKASSNAPSSVASESKNTDGKKQDDFNAEIVVASIIRNGDEYSTNKLTKARLQEVLGAFARRYANDTEELQSRNDELEQENKRLTKERDHARDHKSGLRVANVDRIIALEKIKDERAKEAAAKASAEPEDDAIQPATNNDVLAAQPTTTTPSVEQEPAEVEVPELDAGRDIIMADVDTPPSANSLEASPDAGTPKTFVSRFLRPFKYFFSPAKNGPRPFPTPAEQPEVPLGELPANRKRAAPDPEPDAEPPAQRPALEANAVPGERPALKAKAAPLAQRLALEQAQQEAAQEAEEEAETEAEAAPSITAAPEPQVTQPALSSTPAPSVPSTPTPNMARKNPPRAHAPFGNALGPISERTEPSQASIRRTPGTSPVKRRTIDQVKKQKAREQWRENIRRREMGRPPPAFNPITGVPNPPGRENPHQKKARIDALIMDLEAELDEDEEAAEESKRLAKNRVNTDDLAQIPHRRPGDPSSTFRLPEIDSDGEMDVDEDVDDWKKNIMRDPDGTEWYLPKPAIRGKDFASLTEMVRRCEQEADELEQAQEQAREQARKKEVFPFPTVGTMPTPRKDGQYDDFLGKKFSYGFAAYMRGQPDAVEW